MGLLRHLKASADKKPKSQALPKRAAFAAMVKALEAKDYDKAEEAFNIAVELRLSDDDEE